MLPDDTGALLAGILLGIEGGISEDVTAAFEVTGTSHIIAISGFNLTLAASVVSAMAQRLRRKRVVLALSLSVIWIYVCLVGAAPAVARAGVMSSLIVLAQMEQRRVHGPTALAAAVLGLTLWNPHTLWDVGFQLSVGAMLALIIYVPHLERWASAFIARVVGQARAEQIVRALSEVLLVTIAVQITTLGVMAVNFKRLSLIAPVVNCLILPVQPAVMLLGALALGAGLVLPPLGAVLAWGVWVFLKVTLSIVMAMAQFPHASIELGNVASTVAWAYYGLLIAITWALTASPAQRRQAWTRVKGARPALRAGGIAAVTLLLTYGVTRPDGRLHTFFLDAGAGDAVLIVTPNGRQILVDGGSDPRALSASLGRRIPFWDRSLDMVLLTSPDDDRIAGLIPVLERYAVAFVGVSPETGSGATFARWLALLDERPADSWGTLAAGAVLVLDDCVTLDVLWPHPGTPGPHPGTPGPNPGTPGPNPGTPGPLVLRLVHGDVAVILMGDATSVVEEAVVARYGAGLRSNVLQLPRGGDRSCCGRALLQAVSPQMAVVAPRSSAPLSSLVTARLMDLPLYRIDQYGTVEVMSDGDTIQPRVRVQR